MKSNVIPDSAQSGLKGVGLDNKEIKERRTEMEFIEKMGDAISAKGREAADKARELTETAKLKSRISTCEEVIKKNYLEIGRLYFEMYGDRPEATFEKQCRNIANARKGVQELQAKIDERKGL